MPKVGITLHKTHMPKFRLSRQTRRGSKYEGKKKLAAGSIDALYKIEDPQARKAQQLNLIYTDKAQA